jgi:uncharacterized protein YqjF (DUF2071 family)
MIRQSWAVIFDLGSRLLPLAALFSSVKEESVVQRPRDSESFQTHPARRWVWSQHWLDVLFLHWRVPVADLRPHIPAALTIDTRDGQAWVSLVLFRLRVRPAWLPFMPGLSTLVEVNLRTYVHFRDRPGIWFLSVHADNRWAMALAKLLTAMPYIHAKMAYRRNGDRLQFSAQHPGSEQAWMALDFSPTGPNAEKAAGTLDYWLLERYRLYAWDRKQMLCQAEVSHPPWAAQQVDVSMSANSIGETLRLDLSRHPDRAHFSPGLHAYFGSFRSLDEILPPLMENLTPPDELFFGPHVPRQPLKWLSCHSREPSD